MLLLTSIGVLDLHVAHRITKLYGYVILSCTSQLKSTDEGWTSFRESNRPEMTCVGSAVAFIGGSSAGWKITKVTKLLVRRKTPWPRSRV